MLRTTRRLKKPAAVLVAILVIFSPAPSMARTVEWTREQYFGGLGAWGGLKNYCWEEWEWEWE